MRIDPSYISVTCTVQIKIKLIKREYNGTERKKPSLTPEICEFQQSYF